MSHPRKKSVSKCIGPKQAKSKILFMPSAGQLATLVETINTEQTATPMNFSDPHAALSWAVKNQAGFVFFQGTEIGKG